ncbi:2TM domain-containing protein [Stella humosa]|uniref:2TM domain-containing protein n=2 Tax=Stella humosa TaxID=94 RepID=A0A3N1KNL6_9PROT|nr:2TM domain-containing protein [Stella humosa]ROP80832.1 2TM domain-containing protein [Stella humosa]BBK33376.1 hypothetical protein STHU_40100 [Stella humosa]
MKRSSHRQKQIGFNIHAFSFTAVMLLLVVINIFKGPPYWVLWVLLGWAVGLLSHWWFVLGPGIKNSESR